MGRAKMRTCRLCGKKEKIHQNNIVMVTCSDCRRAMFSAKTLRKQAREAKKAQTIEVKEIQQKEVKVETVTKTEERNGYITLSSFST
tara:strand:- start:3132 stop:3392 length:261 start_codon:yes stop_codon:yes gene_type:complete